ncbi:hypothetical protein E2320_014085, partial [Naja naja]
MGHAAPAHLSKGHRVVFQGGASWLSSRNGLNSTRLSKARESRDTFGVLAKGQKISSLSPLLLPPLQTTSSALKGAIQLGITHTVGSLSTKPERDVLMQDFYVVESIFFPG